MKTSKINGTGHPVSVGGEFLLTHYFEKVYHLATNFSIFFQCDLS